MRITPINQTAKPTQIQPFGTKLQVLKRTAGANVNETAYRNTNTPANWIRRVWMSGIGPGGFDGGEVTV
jgi:hypothetical protein